MSRHNTPGGSEGGPSQASQGGRSLGRKFLGMGRNMLGARRTESSAPRSDDWRFNLADDVTRSSVTPSNTAPSVQSASQNTQVTQSTRYPVSINPPSTVRGSQPTLRHQRSATAMDVDDDAETRTNYSRLHQTHVARPHVPAPTPTVVSSRAATVHVDQLRPGVPQPVPARGPRGGTIAGDAPRQTGPAGPAGAQSQSRADPPQGNMLARYLNEAAIEWEDPPSDEEDVEEVLSESELKGEPTIAYKWAIEGKFVDFPTLTNPPRLLEVFPSLPTIPDHVYRGSSTWLKDREVAGSKPRKIANCHRDRYHCHGQAIHPWRAPDARVRRHSFVKDYVPTLYDLIEFADRALGPFVQLTLIARVDDGPDKKPDVLVHMSRLIMNNPAMQAVGMKMADAFKNGLADPAHDNLSNYRKLLDANKERKKRGETGLDTSTGVPQIHVRDMYRRSEDGPAIRDNSRLPPEVARQVGLRPGLPLYDQRLYEDPPSEEVLRGSGLSEKAQGKLPMPPSPRRNDHDQDDDHDHDHAQAPPVKQEEGEMSLDVNPSSTPEVIAYEPGPIVRRRHFRTEMPEVSPFGLGDGLVERIESYLNAVPVDSDEVRENFLQQIAIMYWCARPSTWMERLERMCPSHAHIKHGPEWIFNCLCEQHVYDWAEGLR